MTEDDLLSVEKQLNKNEENNFTNYRLFFKEDFPLDNNKFQNIEQRLNKIDTKLDSIGALAAAQSRIPAVIDGSKNYAVSIGIGNYGSKSAMAIGGTMRINDNIFSSASFAIADHDSSSSSLGVSFAW